MIGYLFRPIAIAPRAGFLVAGLCLLLPDQIGPWAAWTDLAGLAIGIVLFGYEFVIRRRNPSAPAASLGG